jgi:SdrD B-like domain/Secretion system C-terminal sorting domain
MKNLSALVVLFMCAALLTGKAFSQISGLVYRDYNNNGTRQAAAGYTEPIVAGVTIKAFNASDALLATVTSTSTGYNFSAIQVPSGTAVRLEFTIPTSGSCTVNGLFDFSAGSGATSGTAVRFLTAGAVAININFAINDPNDYQSDAAPFSNTFLFLPRYHSGNATGTGTSAAGGVFYKIPYTAKGQVTLAASNLLATNAQVGTCYGVAYSKQAGRVFTSAFMKRHNGFGPANGTFNNAPGAIYIINPALNSGTGAASYFTSLDALGYPTHNSTGTPAYGPAASYNITGTGVGATISYTTNGLGVIGTNSTRGLPNDSTSTSMDPAAFGQVGRVSLGDIEISDDGRYLFVTNFFDRKLYQLQLNSITNPTSATVVNSWNIPNPPLRSASGIPGAATTYTGANDGINFYDGTRGLQRPFALKYYKGKVYVGSVTTGEGTGAVSTQDNNTGAPEYTDLWAYVWEFNPATGTFTSTPMLQSPLNFNRGTNADGQSETWKRWTNTVPTAWTGIFTQYQQPMFSDIEFDTDGTMILGFRDRFGDQSGYNQGGINGSISISGQAMGDIYRAFYNPSTCLFEMEQNAKEGPGSPKVATAGAGNGDGPSNYTSANGEFYYRDEVYNANTSTSVGSFHLNCLSGALAIIKGTDTATVTTMDPVRAWSSGVSWYSNTSGDNGRDYEMFAGAGTGTFPTPATGAVGKANGLGDIELLTSLAPMEIGNRVWNDTNGDGIQGAGEAGINNVTVQLYSNGVDGIPGNADDAPLGTTNTNTSGEWYFNTSNVPDGDPTIAGNQAGPQPNFSYNIRIGSADWTSGAGTGDLAGFQLTKTDKIGNGAVDLSDNDAALNSSNTPMISITTGAMGVNNHDLDFGFKTLASLGDKVWRDDDRDGVQDPGEPGVAGITVTLFNSGGVAIATTATDAYGNYLFDNLTPADYTVGFTPPANYIFTTSSGTAEADAANSDVNVTTGRTTTVTLSAGENQRNIDAGLIFTQPATNSIGDRVWFDTDGDGVQDANEAGVSGVSVTLYAADGVTVIATTVTDAFGNYIFTGLPASTNYIVGVTPPAGMNLTSTGGTTPTNNTDSDFSITTFKTATVNTGAAGTQITGVDAGLINQPANTASIGDRVWNDLNNNGVQNAGEPGVPGVTVNLYRDANGDGLINGAEASTPYLTTVTNAFGNYIFNNLPAAPGSGTIYQVGFVAAGGYSLVTSNVGTDDYADSDANPAGGRTGFYLLKQGQRNLSVDAGITQNSPAGTARLGDRVWYDADQDGVQDAGETNIAGVTVTLYQNGPDGLPGTGDDVVVATTATDMNGNYLFANLAASAGATTEYNVGFSNLPQGYSFTPIWSSNDANATNSDANPASGRTGTINLSAGEIELDVDAGLIAGVPSGLGSIGNKVWWDFDNDNIQDAGEPGVTGVTVTLLDAGTDGIPGNGDDGASRTTTTNAAGEYIFTGLPAGNYAVRFSTLPAGAVAVTQNSGADDTIDSDGGTISGGNSTTAVYTLAAGEDNLTVDLGIRNTARGSFGNRVWLDNGAGGGIANDGIQNGTEAGVAGVMVTLVNASGQPVDRSGTVTTTPITTVTDANGYYSFADLAPAASFAALFNNIPAGFNFTSKVGVGGGDDIRSDADLTSGLTPAVAIVANTHNTTLDAGINSTRAALGNYVWIDDDGDGVQDSNEPGVPGVTVTLYRPGFGLDGITGNADDALAVASMITDQAGAYMFTNLVAGTYEVEFSTIPGGTIFTQRNGAGDNGDNTNSDAVPLVGNPLVARTAGVILTAGEVDLTIDAGLFRPRAVIGNYVWVDSDNDGIQDSNEPGAPGIRVSLVDNGGNVVAVAITDGNGFYLFPNVAPGSYTLNFANLPTGASFTTQDQTGGGGNDNNDSDVNIGTGSVSTFVVTTATNNLSFDAGIVGLITLPVRLEFTATKQNNSAVLVWKVSAERDVQAYTLERSVNNQNFAAIYTTNSDGRSEYSKVDIDPGTGVYYYRVKVANLDGSIEYSEVRIIRFDSKGTITIFPNPATDKVHIQLPENWQQGGVITDVINQAGQIVVRQQKQLSGQVQVIDISNLPAGVYHLRISNRNGETDVKKLTVQ